MLGGRQRRRHAAGEDKTDPSTLMKPLLTAMETIRLSLCKEGEDVTLDIALGKNDEEKEKSEAKGTIGA